MARLVGTLGTAGFVQLLARVSLATTGRVSPTYIANLTGLSVTQVQAALARPKLASVFPVPTGVYNLSGAAALTWSGAKTPIIPPVSYVPRTLPIIEGGDARYLFKELQAIANAIKSIHDAIGILAKR